MKSRWIVLLLIMSSFLLQSCRPTHEFDEPSMKTLSKITYTNQSGSILPELQYSETFVITLSSVTFTRKGILMETNVNEGSWEITVDREALTKLFDQLKKVNCEKIKRIEAEDVPDGAGTSSYELFGRKAVLCSLYYDPGTSYEKGELVVEPIQMFLKEIPLPDEILNRTTP